MSRFAMDNLNEVVLPTTQVQMAFGRDSADDEVDDIINRAQQAGITVSDEVRKRVLALVKKK